MLRAQSQREIKCSIQRQACSLPVGCLSPAAPWSFFKGREESFDETTQQSLVFTEAMSHIDTICLHYEHTHLLDQSIHISKATMRASAESLSTITVVQSLGRQSVDLANEALGRLDRNRDMAAENLELTTKAVQVAEQVEERVNQSALKLEHNSEMLISANQKLKSAEVSLAENLRLTEEAVQLGILQAEQLEKARTELGFLYSIGRASVVSVLQLHALLDTAKTALTLLIKLLAFATLLTLVRWPLRCLGWFITNLVQMMTFLFGLGRRSIKSSRSRRGQAEGPPITRMIGIEQRAMAASSQETDVEVFPDRDGDFYLMQHVSQEIAHAESRIATRIDEFKREWKQEHEKFMSLKRSYLEEVRSETETNIRSGTRASKRQRHQ